MKIVFVNEAYSIGSAFGIDVAKANEIFLLDRHLNISPRYLRPGMPFGGSCLPKDLRAMQHFSRKLNVQAPMLNSLLESNKQFQQRLLDKVIDKKLKKVLLVGITFKNHTDDVRESPMLKLATDIIESGKCSLKIYDEDINLTTLRIENANIVKYVENDLKQAIADAELIVVSKRFMSEVIALNTTNKPTLNFTDLDKYPAQENIEGIY
jgi:GDP-mannose 6-dehydrogenase